VFKLLGEIQGNKEWQNGQQNADMHISWEVKTA